MISGQLEHWQEHGYGWWAVEERLPQEETSHTGEVCAREGLIGWCGLTYLPETGEVEVAYLLDKAFWGNGLATEAARASLQYGFERVGVERIVGIVHPENTASRRVLVKLGMSFVDQARYFGMDCYRYACRSMCGWTASS